MDRFTKMVLLLSLGLAPSLAVVGCVQPEPTGIAQLDPYLGPRPQPISALPEKPKVKREAPRLAGAEAGWVPAKGISNRWNCIVVHHSANDKSTPAGMREWHVKGRGWDALGYHFVIGNGIGYGDGKVYVGERWTKQMHGAHCKTPGNRYNEHGVGICLIGDLDRHPPTKKQIQALAKLTSFISGKCKIPRSQILTHGGITHKTACPGKHFSLKPVLQQMTLQNQSASAADADEPSLSE